jgi:hypothetical protein
MIHDRDCEWQVSRGKCSCGLHQPPQPEPSGLGAAVRAAREEATGKKEPVAPKRGFA